MTKKKNGDNSDLTRIEDLSEFLHQKDSDLDSIFDTFSPSESSSLDLNDLEDQTEDLPELPDLPEALDEADTNESSYFDEVSDELSSELEEVSFDNEAETTESSFNKTSFGENPFGNSELETDALIELEDVTFEDVSENSPLESVESESQDDSKDYSNNKYEHHNSNLLDEDLSDSTHAPPEAYTNTSEKFEDVKTFAQNFSYGKAGTGGGNPPYTIIAKNIKYKEDADNILDILDELGLINDQNKNDTQKAMEFGALIIPQISEYTAIILAHKLRRFDLDLQVGLSDEVHPSKSGMDNPRGLLKKENLKQNISESLKLSDLDISIKDIIISTTSAIPGYFVESYIGVQTTFTIVEESELEKLQYVARTKREQSELFDYKESEVSTEKIFQDYQNSFEILYADLTMQLKQKAFTQHANALLGLTFLLSPIQFDRSYKRVNAYQITCSATLAIIAKENS